MDDFPFDSWFVVFFPSHLFLSFAHSLPFAVLSFTVTGGHQIAPFSLLLSVSHCFFLLDSKLTRPIFLCGLLQLEVSSPSSHSSPTRSFNLNQPTKPIKLPPGMIMALSRTSGSSTRFALRRFPTIIPWTRRAHVSSSFFSM